jgi:hypothetical protein
MLIIYDNNIKSGCQIEEMLNLRKGKDLMKIKRNTKNYINYFFDFILLFSLAFNLFSSYILWFVIPGGWGLHGYSNCLNYGYGYGNMYPVFGYVRSQWIDIHNWASVILLTIILLHIILHWKWIVKTFKNFIFLINGSVRKVIEQYVSTIMLFILFILDCFSGFVIWLFLPRGALDYNAMLSGNGRTFWGLQRNAWLDLHVWIAVLILSISIIHLILNWKWIVNVSKNVLNSFLKHFKSRNSFLNTTTHIKD